MNRRVLISYKWHPERGETKWLFWLEKKLEAKGFQVILSRLETPNKATDAWVNELKTVYDVPDAHVYSVQHDPGCLTVLTYLEYLADRADVESALLVAGVPKLTQPAVPRRQLQASSYVRLDSPDEIAIFDESRRSAVPVQYTEKSQFENFDAKLVVLYSADPSQIGEQDRKVLKAKFT